MPKKLPLHQYFLSTVLLLTSNQDYFLIVASEYLLLYKLYVLNHLVFLEFWVFHFYSMPLCFDHLSKFFVVKPNISTLTEHRSKVLDKISAHIAAIVIGLPLIDPELSINKVTTVSLKSRSFSFK